MAEIIGCTVETLGVLDEIKSERWEQFKKWGKQEYPPNGWLSILGKEFGSVCRAVCENDPERYREELVHVAAVATAMMEDFDQGGW